MAPPVSVIVNTYNRAGSLRRTLEACTHLDYPDFEVIVVNGPSTDDTEALLEEWSGRVKVARCPNRNLSESRNIGIAMASGEIVAFIDDDAYPDPAWLDCLVEGFDSDEVVAVGGPTYNHTGAELQARYSLGTRFGDARVSFGPNPTEYLNAPWSQEFVYTIGTNSSFRRDRLVEIGGFDEEIEYYLDETDLCCRFLERGYVIKALDDGFVYHKFLESDIRTPNRAIKSRFSVLKNKCYFALKHGLRTASFYEVCRNLSDAVEQSRTDYRWNVEHGLLTEEDLLQFERDVHAAFNTALQAFRSGVDRTRPAEWFGRSEEPFLPFPTRRRALDKLHVCFLSQEYPPGPVNGIARFVHTLATGLAGQGHLIRVLTRGESHDRVDFEDGVWVHRLRIEEHPPPESLQVPKHLWDYSATLRDELRRVHAHRPVDLVQGPNWDLELIAVLLDGSFRTVLSLHTPLSTVRHVDPQLVAGNPHLERLIELDRFCVERAGALLANGRTVLDAVESSGADLAGRPVAVIPHGMADRSEDVGEEHPEGLNVLFVGRLEKRKGIDTLLSCIPALVQEYPEVRFTIAGNDDIPGDTEDGSPYRQAFQDSTAWARVRDHVSFTGLVEDEELRRLYAGCDVFVAPSRFESFGLVLLEAMMFGKPVVAGDNAGMREIVDGNGYLVTPGDPDALHDAIASLLARPDLRADFGARSRQLFEERFALQRMVEETNRFYDGLVGREAVRPPSSPPPAPARTVSPIVGAPAVTVEPTVPRTVPGLAPVTQRIVGGMRCPVCRGDVRVHADAVTSDGRLKTGALICDVCVAVAASVDQFKFDFHARTASLPGKREPLVVPSLGERRVPAQDGSLRFGGTWRQEGNFRLSEGRVGDAVSFTGPFTDAVVRLLRHPWSGIVDLFLDDELVESVDLFMPEGSQVTPVVVARDLELATRTVSVRPRGAKNPASQATQVLFEEIVLHGPLEAGFGPPAPINRGNPYPDVIERHIAATPRDELILECGGGDRRRGLPNHLNFEYLNFELADVYGDIHSVPFQDDTFGLVYSQAVFEHVRNPFEAAEELIRITRPGGLIVTEVAFLQPLHAVPYHFFNMTLWGVQELFKSCTLLESNWFGELSVTVEWLLRSVNLHEKVEPERLQRLVAEFEELDRLVTHDDLKAAASGVYIVARKEPR